MCEPRRLSHLFKLHLDDRITPVPLSVQVGEDVERLFPAFPTGQPARRLGEEEQSNKQNQAGDGLDAPGDAEGRGTGDAFAAAPGDKIHDENTPF